MEKLRAGMVLFDRFELLDACGPLELLGQLPDRVELVHLAEQPGPLSSVQGTQLVADCALADCAALDILLVPGGIGRVEAIQNAPFLAEIKRLATDAPHVGTICTGSVLLAQSGLLAGRRATTNKLAFRWVQEHAPGVNWVPQARWVEDGKFFTSSGISAGMDMTLALISKLWSRDCALELARRTEYSWHEDPDWDPFAELAGLV